jgi:hypothetical protein
MKPNVLAIAAASALFGVAGPTLAQSNTDRSFTHGESKRCESMTGSAKEQCDKQEATKTDGGAPSAPGTASGSSAPGSSSAAPGRDGSFTHGESKHCEKLAGAAKEQCDKEEATK